MQVIREQSIDLIKMGCNFEHSLRVFEQNGQVLRFFHTLEFLLAILAQVQINRRAPNSNAGYCRRRFLGRAWFL